MNPSVPSTNFNLVFKLLQHPIGLLVVNKNRLGARTCPLGHVGLSDLILLERHIRNACQGLGAMSDRSGQQSGPEGQAGPQSAAMTDKLSTREEQPAGVLAQAARLAKEGSQRGRKLVG